MPQSATPNPLDQLKAIHAPTDVSAWPLAWGWWVLIIAALLLVVGGILLWKRYRTFTLAKRQALQLVEQTDPDSPDAVSTLNQILKRVSRHYDGHINTASLYGEKWTDYLVSQLPEKQQATARQSFTEMNALLYQKTPATAEQAAKQKAAVAYWIRYASIYRFSLRGAVRESATHV